MKRNQFLKATAALAGASLLPDLSIAAGPKKKPLRFAFLSDFHIKPGKVPEEGTAKALHHVQRLDDRVDFIINGGDAIMDALDADRAKTQVQFDLFKKSLKQENSLPIHHCIGNHDVWGWFIKQNRPENEHGYGKVWVVEEFEMPRRYYSLPKDAGILSCSTVRSSTPPVAILQNWMMNNWIGLKKNCSRYLPPRISAWYRIFPSSLFVPVYFLIKQKPMAT